MRRLFLPLFAVALLSSTAKAADPDSNTAVPQMSRRDSLELPGLTAGCHVCEWRPKRNNMPAAEFCGYDDNGLPQTGLFECGFLPDCERQCNFLECLGR